MAKKTKKHKPGKKSPKLAKWEMVLPGVVVVIAVLVALSPYIFQFWVTPETQQKLTRAMTQSVFERAPASAQGE